MKKRMFVLAILAVFLMTGLAFAEEMTRKEGSTGKTLMAGKSYQKKMMMKKRMMRRHHRKPRGKNMMMKMAEMLDLNEQQMEKMMQIGANYKKRMIDVKAEKQKEKVDLKLLMHKFDKDMPAIEAKIKKIAGYKAQLHIMKIRMMEEMKTVLTAQQKAKLKDMKMCPWKYRKHKCDCQQHKKKYRKYSEIVPDNHNEATPDEAAMLIQ